MDRSWLANEATFADALRQAARLLVRGVRRPLVTFSIAASLSGAAAAALLVPRNGYAPKLTLRVREADEDPTSMPQPTHKLREYVRQALLTSDRLGSLIRRFHLYPSLARKNFPAALESFREDIGVDVYHNYFAEPRVVGSRPRSARVAISYRNKDPETAVLVTRALGALVVQRARDLRSAESDRAEAGAESELRSVRTEIAEKTTRVATMRAAMQMDAKPDPARQVELVSLMGSLEALLQREDAAEKREAKLSLGAALERRGIGLSVEVADDAALPSSERRIELAFEGVGATFLFGLPLVAMAVGSMRPKRGTA